MKKIIISKSLIKQSNESLCFRHIFYCIKFLCYLDKYLVVTEDLIDQRSKRLLKKVMN